MDINQNFRTFKNYEGKVEEFTVFIIHGRSNEWEKANEYIREHLNFKTIVSINDFKGGNILQKIKKTIWSECDCAVAVLSPDDKLENGTYNARQNVIYELAYCQGFWDSYYWEDEELEPVILIKEKSVELNSDLNGSEFLEYNSGKIRLVYKKLANALENIYNYLNETKNKGHSTKNASYFNDFTIIKNYLSDRSFTFMSFEKISENINPRFNEDYVMKLIEKFPDKIRRAKIKGRPGIKLLQ